MVSETFFRPGQRLQPLAGADRRRPSLSDYQEQCSDISPIWSRDGQQIAFISDRGGQHGMWIIPAVGGAPTLIKTLETEGKGAPVLWDWARNGETVFYEWNNKLISSVNLRCDRPFSEWRIPRSGTGKPSAPACH
jgi:Tol biopolymer transport system component